MHLSDLGLNETQFFTLALASVIGFALTAAIADGLESRHWFILGSCAAIAVFTLGYLLIHGGLG